jgi:hypothetical protein
VPFCQHRLQVCESEDLTKLWPGCCTTASPHAVPFTTRAVQICQTNYKDDLLKWVAPENLPEWLGGTSKGTLLDDCGPWSDPEVLRRYEAELPAARQALKHRGETGITPVPELIEADGYASPKWVSLGGGHAASTAAALAVLSVDGAQRWRPSIRRMPPASARLFRNKCVCLQVWAPCSPSHPASTLLSWARPYHPAPSCAETQPVAAAMCDHTIAVSPTLCCQVGGLICVCGQLRQQRVPAAGAGWRQAGRAPALSVGAG